ncbi:MAG: beta-propeller fold lactonase family protein [Proteobacteria bacterium]|nr:beta-propeller fold lactonase family protein [Pseudomonadota bacterium]
MIRLASSARACAVALALVTCLASGQAGAARAYVSNEDDGTVSIIDTQRLESVETIAVGKRPRGLVLSRDGGQLYVVVSGLPKCPPPLTDAQCAKMPRDPKADGVVIVDTAAMKVSRVLKGVTDPERAELSADQRTLFVTNEDAARVSVIDIAHGKVVATVPVGHEPEGVRLSPNGQWLLVTSESDNNIAVIDAAGRKVLHTVLVGTRPRDVAFSPDSSSAYVTGEGDASVYRVALPSGAPATQLVQLRPEARPMGILLDAPRERLYVSTGRGGTLAALNLGDGKLVKEVPIGARPWGIALSPDGRRIVTANGTSHDVSVLDTDTLAVVGKVTVGKGPWGVVIGP